MYFPEAFPFKLNPKNANIDLVFLKFLISPISLKTDINCINGIPFISSNSEYKGIIFFAISFICLSKCSLDSFCNKNLSM